MAVSQLSPLDEEIVALYSTGSISLEAIGRKIGVCRETVARRLRKLGIDTSKTGPKKGYRQSEEHRRNIAKAQTGLVFTDEHRRHLSEKMTGVQAGSRHWNWNGGKKHRTDGYIYVSCPGHPRAVDTDYVMEHILVMERLLDRYLEDGEQVHHINGVKDDNQPENLMLFRDARDHQMWHQFFKRRENLA